ncbi:MAG TPA: 2-keto-4-pentenoate hydratase, partial [Casimicrobiaceae bacterium]|nr:2-keto-4-pentenoate hydratase [Casimicrobiaceae bacterium]
MIASAYESAAQFLLAARNRGTPGPRIPEEYRPPTIPDALAIQSRIAQLVGQPIGGYKCSVPSEPRPVALAPIFAPAIYRDSPCPAPGSGGGVRAEPEIAFVLGRPLRGPGVTVAEALAAVDFLLPALEIIDSRIADWKITLPDTIADNAS